MFALIVEKIFGGFFGLKKKASKRKVFQLIYRIYMRECNSFIGITADIKGKPILPHGLLGIFISGEATIGKNCVIFQQVTIGSNTIPYSKGKGAPVIGDNCYIGTGAKVIGGITIGDNVRVGANCVVFQDIPSNSVVVSQPPKVIQKDCLDNKFYKKSGGKWVYENNGQLIPVQDNDTLIELNK